MPAKVSLTVTKGKLLDKAFAFDERTTCIMGRADDCQPQLPNDDDHRTISRNHCLLDINPPDIRIRDFGSLNGTFVNGQKIGQRHKGMTPEEGARMAFPEYDLKSGDEIALGGTVFRVAIQVEEPPRPEARHCARCGRDVSAEVSEHRHGDFVCSRCQADPLGLAQRLLKLAATGRKDLLAIQGYAILRELGKGGMGAVYLARHQETGRQVALKVMLPRIAADADCRARFLAEAELTRALRHPHVVQLHDLGYSECTFFFTLEYCDGGSVDGLMKQRGGTLPVDEAVGLTLHVLAGLEYAHQAEVEGKLSDGGARRASGLVHRDLKPQNIFLAGSGGGRVAKVGDFGLAKAFDLAGLSGQTRTGDLMGTPVFMPRQQVINFKYAKPDVDVWAAAAALYCMLTGCVPRDFPDGQDPWLTVLTTDAVPIRRRKATVPSRLAEVIDHALIDKPAIPFKSAAEFKRALAGAL